LLWQNLYILDAFPQSIKALKDEFAALLERERERRFLFRIAGVGWISLHTKYAE